MRFVLQVDLESGALAGEDRAAELGRILRYWGGNLKYYKLVPGDEAAITDSDYKPVGKWSIVAEPDK